MLNAFLSPFLSAKTLLALAVISCYHISGTKIGIVPLEKRKGDISMSVPLNEELNLAFGQRILDLMLERDLDIAKLARKAGIANRSKLSSVINVHTDKGKKSPRALTPAEIIAVARVLEVTPAYLLTGYDEDTYIVGKDLGLSNETINRLSSLQERNDNTLSDAINMFFVDSEEIESVNNMTSAESLLVLFREFVLCPERELVVETMNATNPAFALTKDEALQLRLINHLSEYKRKRNKSKGGKENETGKR